MKRVLSLMLLFGALLIALPSCSDDKDEPDNFKNEILGTWDATDVYMDGSWINIVGKPSVAIMIQFNKDGSYFTTGYFGTGTGKYKVSGKTITTYYEGEVAATYYVKQLSGNYAEITMTMGNSSLDIKAKRR